MSNRRKKMAWYSHPLIPLSKEGLQHWVELNHNRAQNEYEQRQNNRVYGRFSATLTIHICHPSGSQAKRRSA